MPVNPTVTSDPVFITVLEASKRFGYTTGALYALASRGKITTKKVEGTIYVSVSEIEKRFEANTTRIKSFKKAVRRNRNVVTTVEKPTVITTSCNKLIKKRRFRTC